MNQHIRTIAILGAGAVGSYLVMGLSDKYKENLWVIADGERKDRLAKNGLNINDKVYSLHIQKATTESTSESRTSLPARIQGLLLLRRFLLTHRLLFI